MNLRIVVKEIDRLKSSLIKGKVLSEYLICLVDESNDNKKLVAYIELGKDSKDDKINELLSTNNLTFDKNVTEIKFEEYIKEK